MVAAPIHPYVTPEEYLERERRAETKSEYFDGVIVAMAGASMAHNTITFNLVGELAPQLRGGPCRGMSSDQRVRILAGNSYVYPDVVIVCGEPRHETVRGLESLLNPTLVIEVLSPSTERLDRADKFDSYRALDSLQCVLFVAQDRPRIECYTRRPDSWRIDVAHTMDASMDLPAVSSSLSLARIYENVEFPSSDLVLDPGSESC
jgi:Uma2 family endonuclease